MSKKPSHERLSDNLSIRINKQQRVFLERQAHKHGITKGQALRLIIDSQYKTEVDEKWNILKFVIHGQIRNIQ